MSTNIEWVEQGGEHAVAAYLNQPLMLEARACREGLGIDEPPRPTPQLRRIYDEASPIVNATLGQGRFHHLNALGEFHWRRWPLDNVWLGVSVEDQRRAEERIPLLLECPAAVRFLSVEPLLGPVDITRAGPGRGCATSRGFGRSCGSALAGFGMLSEDLKNALWGLHDRKGGDPSEWPEDLRVQEFPEVRHG